jgi:glycosyltransferase involved in cell wall biosynthesis
MAPALSPRVWEAMAERAADVDAFVAVSRYYAERVRNRLRVPAARLHVVPVGIDPQGHRPAALPFDPPVVGYLSRISESQGFGLLVEAFRLLKQHPRLAGLKLAATGGLTGDDRRFARRVRRRLAARGWEGDLELLPEFDRDRRLQLLQSLTVLSVPALRGEAFGTYLLEAMASGVPVVQPRLGAFPEIIEAAGGGVLYEPNTPAALAAALQSLLLSPERARELGRRGREGVVAHFGTEKMVTDLEGVYKGVAREV